MTSNGSEQPLQIGIVVPAYNDTTLLKPFLQRLVRALPGIGLGLSKGGSRPVHFCAVVVDDGSAIPIQRTELEVQIESAKNGPELCCDLQFYLLRHLVNLGQGAALRTGIHFAQRELGCAFFVTMDSDGQHRLEDLQAVLQPVFNGEVDIVFGNRFAGQLSAHIPPSRKILLRLATLFERVITGLRLHDAHNGYRAFNALVAQNLKIKQNRMAHATEIKQIVSRLNYRYAEVPVSIEYSAETLAKGQSNSGSFTILKDLLKSYLFES